MCLSFPKTITQKPESVEKRVLTVVDSKVKNIESENEKNYKIYYNGEINSWSNYRRYDHRIKCCKVGFTSVISLLHCGTNDVRKDLIPQEIA